MYTKRHTFTTKVLLLMFAALAGVSAYALWNISTGLFPIQLAWPWLISLVVSAIGILVLARNLK